MATFSASLLQSHDPSEIRLCWCAQKHFCLLLLLKMYLKFTI